MTTSEKSQKTNSETLAQPTIPPFFLERKDLVEELISKIKTNYFIAVLGEPGSGKSSLIYNELLSEVAHHIHGREGVQWRIAPIRPGVDPVGSLANALALPDVLLRAKTLEPDYPGLIENNFRDSDEIEKRLRGSGSGLIEVYEKAKAIAEEKYNLLIVIDEFEELFRYRNYLLESERAGDDVLFINLLMKATRRQDVGIYVILTLRPDYLIACSNYRGLMESINASRVFIPILPAKQLTASIKQYLRNLFDVSEDFINYLSVDLEKHEHQNFFLYKIQHTLKKTLSKFNTVSPPPDTDPGRFYYDLSGSLDHAIDLHCDEVFNKLTSEEQQFCEKIFKAITVKDNNNIAIRRPTRFIELVNLCLGDKDIVQVKKQVKKVLSLFSSEDSPFLDIVNTGHRPYDPSITPILWNDDTIIDISNEALIENWGKLEKWVEKEAIHADIYKRLVDDAIRFKQGKGSLLKGNELSIGRNWITHNVTNKSWAQRYVPLELDSALQTENINNTFSLAIAFLNESIQKDEKEKNAKIEELKYQAEKDRKATKIMKRRAYFALAAFLFSLIALGFASKWYLEGETKKKNLELLNFVDVLSKTNVIEASGDSIFYLKNKILNDKSINTESKVIDYIVESTNLMRVTAPDQFVYKSLILLDQLHDALSIDNTLKYEIELDRITEQAIDLAQKALDSKKVIFQQFPLIYTLLSEITLANIALNSARAYSFTSPSTIFSIASVNDSLNKEKYAVGRSDNFALVYQKEKKDSIKLNNTIRSLHFINNGTDYLLASSDPITNTDNCILYKLFDSGDKLEVADSIALAEPIRFMTTYNEGKDIIAASRTSIFYFDIEFDAIKTMPDTIYSYPAGTTSTYSMAFDEDSGLLMLGSDGMTLVFDMDDYKGKKIKPIHSIEHRDKKVTQIAINKNRLAFGSDNGDIWVTQYDTLKSFAPVVLDSSTLVTWHNEHAATITGLSFNEAYNQMISSSIDGNIWFWNLDRLQHKDNTDNIHLSIERHPVLQMIYNSKDDIVIGQNKSVMTWKSNINALINDLKK